MKQEKWAKHSFAMPSEHWGRIIQSQNIQHRLLKPFTLIEPRLLAHVPLNYDEVFAGTYNNHVVVFYSASVLNKLQGGASSLFRGIQALQRLVGLAPNNLKDYKCLHA